MTGETVEYMSQHHNFPYIPPETPSDNKTDTRLLHSGCIELILMVDLKQETMQRRPC